MTNETNQTAVEWLLEWMGKNQYFIGNDLLKAVQQAKEMEKQQMIDYKKNHPTKSNAYDLDEAEQMYNQAIRQWG